MQIEAREPEETSSNPLLLSIDRFAKLGFGTPLDWQAFCDDTLDSTVIDRSAPERQNSLYNEADIAKPISHSQYNGRDANEDGDERDGAEEKNVYLSKEYSLMTASSSTTGVRKRQSDHAEPLSDSSKRRRHNEKTFESHPMGKVASYESATGIPPNLIQMTHLNLLDSKQGGTRASSPHNEDITVTHYEKNSCSSSGKKRKISGNEYDVKTKIRRTSIC
jgi:hypothetical protein